MLKDYEQPALDPAINEALLDYIARRERDIPAMDALNQDALVSTIKFTALCLINSDGIAKNASSGAKPMPGSDRHSDSHLGFSCLFLAQYQQSTCLGKPSRQGAFLQG